MIRIRSKKDGFRRAGVAHPAEWVVYPDAAFTAEQIEQLRAEPMLQVEISGVIEILPASDLKPADPAGDRGNSNPRPWPYGYGEVI